MLSEASNPLMSSPLNSTGSLISSMLSKQFEANNKPSTSIIINGFGKNKENNEKSSIIPETLSGYIDEATLNKLKGFFLNKNNILLPTTTAATTIESNNFQEINAKLLQKSMPNEQYNLLKFLSNINN